MNPETRKCQNCKTDFIIEPEDFAFTEQSYESFMCQRSYNVFFSSNINDSHDIWFSHDLVDCSDCFGCVSIRRLHFAFPKRARLVSNFAGCATAFKIIPQELAFYRKINLPLPRSCPNCRHYRRTRQRNPPRLWSRSCQCAGKASANGVYQNQAKHAHGHASCANEFQTSYAPDRPEIVYCEECYQGEVV